MEYLIVILLIVILILVILSLSKNINESNITERLGKLETNMIKEVSEFKGDTESVEGRITIGCGEFMAVETLAEICKSYKEKYPLVTFAIHTGTADNISDMMNRGLVDVGLFLEPVSTEGLDYIR